MYVSEQLASAMQCDTSRETSEALVLHCTSMACTALVGLAVHKYGLPMLAVSQAGERAIAGRVLPKCPPLSASSTATGATLPSFGRFVYTRIPTATQDGEL